MARGRHSYKAPMAIASHFGFTRKKWLQLTKGEKMSYIRKYDWETNPEKMKEARKKATVSFRETRMKLLGGTTK
ncbi:MAG: hypothetical protein ACTSSE_18195 [Candidatus Thorarchaeota archaeon]